MPQNRFVGRVADSYDADSPEMFDDALVTATVDFLAAEARRGPGLELGIGTGRVALPLSRRGVAVHGIDISADMIDQLRRKPGADAIGTTIGDFAETAVDGAFSLVYVVFNSIGNLLEQSEWVQTFRNAARHLQPGGRFLVELGVPNLRSLPPGATAVPFDISPGHVGFDTYDIARHRCTSHHYFFREGHTEIFEFPGRYAWPAELDLMAEIAGMTLAERWADWSRAPFTGNSRDHISMWERP
jgi:SAM-dependent methyltransferase